MLLGKEMPAPFDAKSYIVCPDVMIYKITLNKLRLILDLHPQGAGSLALEIAMVGSLGPVSCRKTGTAEFTIFLLVFGPEFPAQNEWRDEGF